MRLLRVGELGKEVPVTLADDGSSFLLTPICEDIDGKFLAQNWVSVIDQALKTKQLPRIDISGLRIGAPVASPGKIVCIGLNYREHALETGKEIPKEPIVFLKATSATAGANDAVVLPPGSTHLDWEVELAVVVGRTLRGAPEAGVTRGIAGYCLFIDYSEREWQTQRGGQWTKGKSFDTFATFGPWISPELEDDTITLQLNVNGELKQNSSTADMIFPVTFLLSYVSQFMTLNPGDIIATGTPAGVGFGRTPPCFLVEGDIVEASAVGLGTTKQRVCCNSR